MAMALDIPPGRYAVAVSGGADSVALLWMLHETPDLALHVVHLNHETRGEHSAGDARFVGDLARQLSLPCTIALRSDIESTMTRLSLNPSARYRAARLELFRRVVHEHQLDAVILAHHADDQAETVLQRLIRGSGYAGLIGMSPRSTLGGLTILRPLLNLRRRELLAFLRARGANWREDQSNASPAYTRNVLRRMLADNPDLSNAMLELSHACRTLRDWTVAHAPQLGETFATDDLAELPAILAHESLRAWLAGQGAPPGDLSPAVLDRLLEMARDAATPPRQDFPGRLQVRRSRGLISAIKNARPAGER